MLSTATPRTRRPRVRCRRARRESARLPRTNGTTFRGRHTSVQAGLGPGARPRRSGSSRRPRAGDPCCAPLAGRRYRPRAQLVAGAERPDRAVATVGDQHLGGHGVPSQDVGSRLRCRVAGRRVAGSRGDVSPCGCRRGGGAVRAGCGLVGHLRRPRRIPERQARPRAAKMRRRRASSSMTRSTWSAAQPARWCGTTTAPSESVTIRSPGRRRR